VNYKLKEMKLKKEEEENSSSSLMITQNPNWSSDVLNKRLII
jgi:hypothetical protein